jgi:hypothetical protein
VSSALTEEIRPGIRRPDWSLVTKLAARTALMGRDRARSGLSKTWGRTLLPIEDLIWRTVIELFVSGGRPPSVLEIAEATGMSGEQARTILGDLQVYDLLALDASVTAIIYAYPFSGVPTEHRVKLCGKHLHAVCAVDALGVASMIGTDTEIESSCRTCGARIEVATSENGRSLSHSRPTEAVLWYDFAYAHAAAASCCPAIAFFCSDAHLEQWLLAQNSERFGSRLTLDEGLEVGRALFEPVLANTVVR